MKSEVIIGYEEGYICKLLTVKDVYRCGDIPWLYDNWLKVNIKRGSKRIIRIILLVGINLKVLQFLFILIFIS